MDADTRGPDEDTDAATIPFRDAVARVRRLLRSSDPDGALVRDPTDRCAYEAEAEHVASLAFMGKTPEFIADYLAFIPAGSDARPRLGRADLISLARGIIRTAGAARPSA